MTELSPTVRAVVRRLFSPGDHARVEAALLSCANDLGEGDDWRQLTERIRLAALRASGGSLDQLEATVAQARIDWRDVLVAGECAESLTEHARWAASVLDDEAP